MAATQIKKSASAQLIMIVGELSESEAARNG
jgi:hypothetical protein